MADRRQWLYYALRGMLTAPDFYKAGYSGAPGAVWELAQINEPNMGLLPADMEAFEAAANEPLAGNLDGALKMWHGTSDANASLSTTLRMAGALMRANKHFEMQVVPGVTHALAPIDTYFTNDVLLFFARHLGGPR